MRKKKKKFGNVIMLGLILLVLFYIFIDQRNVKVTADELVGSYQSDPKEADKIFLNKEIELTGNVKSYFQFKGEKSLLELQTENDELKLYCILLNKETEEKAALLTTGTSVTISGKCIGLNPSMADKFPNSIYIEAEQIK